jgi:hypothetical protein
MTTKTQSDLAWQHANLTLEVGELGQLSTIRYLNSEGTRCMDVFDDGYVDKGLRLLTFETPQAAQAAIHAADCALAYLQVMFG